MSCRHDFKPCVVNGYERCAACGTYHTLSKATAPYNWSGNHSTVWQQAWNVDMQTEGGVSKNRFIIDRIASERRRALDIGCAPGRLLYWLRWAANFREVVGIDPGNPNDIRCLSAFYGEVVTGLFPEATAWMPAGRFDLITALDVFEHVHEPLPFLAEAARLLVPGGQLLLMLPLADELPPDSRMFAPEEHVFIHSARHLHGLLQAAGFEKIKFDRWAQGHETVSGRKR